MNKLILGLAIMVAPLATMAAEEPPIWAFPAPSKEQPPVAEFSGPQQLVGSTRSFAPNQIHDLKFATDWFPNEHPSMPEVVAHGGPGRVLACGTCHLVSGMGRPESARLAGVSAAFIEGELAAYKNGERKGPGVMTGLAQAISDADAKAAAEYFSQLKPLPWVKVVEATNVPKSYVDDTFRRLPAPGGESEALGNRIVELPQDVHRYMLNDPHSGTIAYVPVGSVKKGETLVTTGGAGKTTQCAACHGTGLKGVGDVPGIAGRSPIYVFRQLYNFKNGSRGGASSALMKPVVANLNEDDMLNLAAYVGSLPE